MFKSGQMIINNIVVYGNVPHCHANYFGELFLFVRRISYSAVFSYRISQKITKNKYILKKKKKISHENLANLKH